MSADPYDIIGVARDATPEEIKRAYRKRARETHPDGEGGNEEEFKRVNQANIILSDPQKRERFDRTGETEETQSIPIAAVVIGAFERAMQQAAGRWQYTDIVAAMVRLLESDLRGGKEVNRQMSDAVLKMEKWKGRLSHTGERNLIADHLSRQIEEAQRNIAQNEATMDIVKAAIEHVREYGWEVDKAPTPDWACAPVMNVGGHRFILDPGV